MSNDQTTNSNLWILQILTPVRIISVISIISTFIFQVPWEFASLIYYSFFALFFASFVIELIFYFQNRRTLVNLALKYMLILPFEFIGVVVFAITTLPFENKQEIFELQVSIATIVACTSVVVELYAFIALSNRTPRLDLRSILAVIPLTVLLVYDGYLVFSFLQ